MQATRLTAAAILAATALCTPALAQSAPSPAKSAPAKPEAAPAAVPVKNPVVAKVGPAEIHLSDVSAAMRGLPAQLQQVPPNVLYPMVLNRLIEAKAVTLMARKQGVDKEPDVQRKMQAAADEALQGAFLQKEIGPKITDQALRAIYDKDYANKPGAEEVHARHILVASEDQAKKIIAQLKAGADFAKLAAANSTDPGSKQNGGDLGYFKKGDMVPAFADAAFKLKDGEISPTPVHTEFGWHVIQVLGHRRAPPQTFDQVKGEIRQKVIHEQLGKLFASAEKGLDIQKFNPDGTPMKATDKAEPPPAPAK